LLDGLAVFNKAFELTVVTYWANPGRGATTMRTKRDIRRFLIAFSFVRNMPDAHVVTSSSKSLAFANDGLASEVQVIHVCK